MAVQLGMPRPRGSRTSRVSSAPGNALGGSSGDASGNPAGRGPLSMVADAIASGAVTARAIELMTGLEASTVAAALEHLERMGRVDRTLSQASCPSGGCRSCPSSGTGCGQPLG